MYRSEGNSIARCGIIVQWFGEKTKARKPTLDGLDPGELAAMANVTVTLPEQTQTQAHARSDSVKLPTAQWTSVSTTSPSPHMAPRWH